jgi:poly-gamma-glutamate synthesis protein (capsule biosynthesis protein)
MSEFSHYDGKYVFSATGDCLIFQKISLYKENEFLKVRDIIKESDCAFTNFETIIRSKSDPPRYKRDPTAWMMSPAYVIDELKWMGFELFSLANNHSMDYSQGALIETLKHFKKSNVCFAGTGEILSEARRPCFYNTEKARLALIAINTGSEDGPASDPYGTVPGRPGVNPLRYEEEYILTPENFKKLKEIAENLELPGPIKKKLRFLNQTFKEGSRNDIKTTPYSQDVDGNLKSIQKAREFADLVFVAIHNHVKRRPGVSYFDDTLEYISPFLEEFSRKAIDSGADAILGTGTHTLNGIEIYKGKPIFYGLGNFISQSYQSNPKPYDWYEARGLIGEKDPDKKTVSLYPSLKGEAEKRRIRRLTTSVIAQVHFNNQKMTKTILYPIEIKKQYVQDGRPLLATGENGVEILERLARLSKEYGTNIEIIDDKGVIIGEK